jgi:uncharacterized membrane protein YidH (DUF202 family)
MALSPDSGHREDAGDGSDCKIIPFRRRSSGHYTLRLWFGVLGGPIAFAIDRFTAIVLLSRPCGQRGIGSGLLGLSVTQSVLLLVTILMGLLACDAGVAAWSAWRKTARSEEETTAGNIRSVPFFALGGMFLSLVFLILIVFTGATAIVLAGACP